MAKAAAIPFLDMLDAITDGQGRFAIARFPGTAEERCGTQIVTPMTNVRSGKALAKSTTIPNLNAFGVTPLLQRIDLASGAFSANTNRAIVLLSDGEHNCGGVVAPTDPAVRSRINALEDSGADDIDLYAVGFGKEAPLWLLQELAAGTGGTFHDVSAAVGFNPSTWNPATALQAAFKSVLSNTFGLDAPADPLAEIKGHSVETQFASVINRDRMVMIFLSWRTAGANRLALRVRSSDGQVVSASASGVEASAGDHYKLLTIKPEFLNKRGKVGSNPWQIDIDAGAVAAADTEKYHYSVIVDSRLKMRTRVEPERIRTGNVVTLTAALTDSGQPLTAPAEVAVEIDRPRKGSGNVIYTHPRDVGLGTWGIGEMVTILTIRLA